MKRIYISITFLLIAIIIGGIEVGYITAKSDLFTSRIEAVDELMQKNEFVKAIELCKENEKQWEETAKIFDMLLIHDYVDTIRNNISKMRSYAENLSIEMYFAESTLTKKDLASLKESEYPLINNIL